MSDEFVGQFIQLILLVPKILWNLESFLTNICISTWTLNKYVEPSVLAPESNLKSLS